MQLSIQSFATNKIFCRYCKRILYSERLDHESQICKECELILKNSCQIKKLNIKNEIYHNLRFFIVLKSLILGDFKSQKTQLFKNYLNNYLNHSYQSTIGLDISSKNVFVNNHQIRITINIISHLDRFNIIRREFYSGANLVFLVFNSTDLQSVQDVEQIWNREIVNYQQRASNPTRITKILIGNNWNLCNERVITERKVSQLTNRLSCSGFALCSNSGEILKSNIGGVMNNLHDTFVNVVSDYIEKYKIISG
ncbi:MAG: hypothetical protein HeimC3_07590 [Candidatus Heimdallarchaeota archaeon LC_3]|nr:MAG: hypothetical protein HeimC3_07590 [Candidatus Heimdallarchaeota archaeon LC_3]